MANSQDEVTCASGRGTLANYFIGETVVLGRMGRIGKDGYKDIMPNIWLVWDRWRSDRTFLFFYTQSRELALNTKTVCGFVVIGYHCGRHD